MKRVLVSLMVLAGCSIHSSANNGDDDSGAQPEAATDSSGSNTAGGTDTHGAGGVYSGNFDFNYDPLAAQMAGDWIVLQARLATPPNGTHFDCSGHRGMTTATARYATAAANPGAIGLRATGVEARF